MDVKTYFKKGVSYAGEGEHSKAIENFSKAIELNPQEPLTYYNRGLVCANKGEHDNAIEDFNKAIKIDPQEAYAYYTRGVSTLGKKNMIKPFRISTKQ